MQSRLVSWTVAMSLMTLVCGAVIVRGQTPVEPQENRDGSLAVDEVADAELEDRLARVFSRVERFQNIGVEVADGVVRLSGSVDDPAAAQEAGELAGRFSGVLFVENDIEARTEVATRVQPALEKLKELGRRAMDHLPLIGVALAVILAAWILARVVTAWDGLFRRFDVSMLVAGVIRQFTRLVLVGGGLLLALEILGLTSLIGALAGAAGVFGLALGFAFRDIVENYLAGMLLSLRSPFTVKDWVSVGDFEGSVVRLTSRELILMTLQGNHVRIPNAQVFKSIITNFTKNPLRAFHILVGVGVDEDLSRVQEIGLSTLEAMKGVLEDPEPSMRVMELGDYNVVVRFEGWVDQRRWDFLKVRSESLRVLKAVLDEAGVEMPEPRSTVTLLQPEAGERPMPAKPERALRQAASADVDRETYLDEQIAEEDDAAGEENLLTGRRKSGAKE